MCIYCLYLKCFKIYKVFLCMYKKLRVKGFYEFCYIFVVYDKNVLFVYVFR